jgi:AcrR family transcriptional regulator
MTAAELFADVGYENASMRIIAERCQITKPALYYYFSDKKALFLEIIHNCLQYGKESLQKITESQLPPIDKLVALLDSRFTTFKQHPAIGRFFHVALSGNVPKEFREALFNDLKIYTECIRKVLQEGIQTGVFRDDLDETSFVAALIGGMNVLIVRYLKLGLGDLSPQMAQQFIATLVKGILKKDK